MSQSNPLRPYKASFILDTRNYQEPVETIYNRLQEVIKAVGGTLSSQELLGQKEFARVTKKSFPAGIYVTYYFDAPTTAPVMLQEKLRLDSTINRILIESLVTE